MVYSSQQKLQRFHPHTCVLRWLNSTQDRGIKIRQHCWRKLCCCLVAKLCLTLCDPVDCSLSGSSVQGISQARILEWVAIPFSRGSSWPRNRTCISCTASGFFWVTREAQRKLIFLLVCIWVGNIECQFLIGIDELTHQMTCFLLARFWKIGWTRLTSYFSRGSL